MDREEPYTYIIYKWMWDDFTKEDRIKAYETAKEKGGELYIAEGFGIKPRMIGDGRWEMLKD